MTSSIRSGRPRAGRAVDTLRPFSRTGTTPTTTHQAPATRPLATSAGSAQQASPRPTPHPTRREQPSWEELFGRR
jgi:hypothetical protein